MKLATLVPEPLGVTTETGPEAAPLGTVAVICVAESVVKELFAPWKATAVAPEKFNPVIVTEVPTAPLAGAKPLMETAPLLDPVKTCNREPTRGTPNPVLRS